MENVYYVYVWYVIDTNEVFYIGKGSGNRYKNITKRNKFFKVFYNTHNCDVKIIKDTLTEENAFDLEVKTICFYRENYPEYRLTNQTDGGEGTSGWVPTQDFKEKQSQIHKSQWKDKDFYNKMMNIRRDENGVYKSDEFRNKISQLVQGENNPNYNHNWNKAQKNHLSKLRKELGLAKDENNPNAKSIICIETGEKYSLIKAVLDKYDVKCETSMSVALDNKNKTCAGLHWVTANEDNIKQYQDDDERFKYLIECYLSSKKFTPYIDIETKQIFKNEKDFLSYLQIGKKYFKKYINGISNRYIELREYYGRIYQ